MKGNFSKTDLLKIFKEYGLISIGGLMYSFAWTSILIPAGVMGGGLNGIGLLIYYATGGTNGGIPLGVTFLVLNAVLVGVASLLISLKFGAKTIYAIGFISVAMAVMQQAVPDNVLGLADDKLLSAILGGALAGAGISICFTQGGSTGGTDIIALIINKYKTVSYGKVLMLCDLIIIGCSLFIFKNITSVIYGYVMVAVFGYTIDAVMAGNRQSAQILIVSPKYDQIAERIFSEMHRGVTLLDGEGWYTKTPTKVVMVVCRKNETGILFRVIKEVDPHAFMTFGSVMGVYGLGFEALKNSLRNPSADTGCEDCRTISGRADSEESRPTCPFPARQSAASGLQRPSGTKTDMHSLPAGERREPAQIGTPWSRIGSSAGTTRRG